VTETTADRRSAIYRRRPELEWMNRHPSFTWICSIAYCWWLDGVRSHIWFDGEQWCQDVYQERVDVES
jgi:hypothetical protein